MIDFIKFTPLWTDFLLYILIGMIGVFFWGIRKNPTLLEPWKKVIQKPLNIFVMMLLSGFILIATLDSIHYTNGTGQTKSVLDALVKESIEHQETSYSAPFALYGFNKETFTQADGRVIRDYPRLKYAGQHLKNDSDKSQDIISKIGQAALMALEGVVLLYAMGLAYKKFKNNQRLIQRVFPTKTFLVTLYIMLFLVCFVGLTIPYYHMMGTSKIGEDVLYEAIKSIRTGVLIGTLTTLVMLPFAIFFGILAGYLRGWIDDLIQYLYTTLSSIPGVLLIAASVLSLQVLMTSHSDWFTSMAERSDARLLALCIILGVTSWTGLCRLLRGEALKLREIDYVLAARSLGVSHFKIMLKHLLPNMSHIILISIALDFSGLVLAEAVLSYIGVGVDPTSYSWGSMINGARLEMSRLPVVWWSLTAAFIFMFTLVLSANIFADSLRDAFDPRMRDQK
jgi:peptide/nickel transport system permease protein